jgi:hypothetical protein
VKAIQPASQTVRKGRKEKRVVGITTVRTTTTTSSWLLRTVCVVPQEFYGEKLEIERGADPEFERGRG